MARVTILGAGDMGTALATPLAHNGHDIVLWGTERDEEIVSALCAGRPHPRLDVVLAPNVKALPAHEAAQALDHAEVVVVAITSDAVRPVLTRLCTEIGQPDVVVTVAKGFDGGRDGTAIHILPRTIGEFVNAPIVAVGGPSKANEVAHGQPTSVVFGSNNSGALAAAKALFQTPTYRVTFTDDIIGLEICAAMKNAYAIALGIADGLERRTGQPHHNLRAALFPVAVAEMAALAHLQGGRRETAYGLAGAGDLQVTITSGRNRLLGELVGSGDHPDAAVHSLSASGTTIEGYPAVAFGHRLYRQAVEAGTINDRGLPLLDAIWRILYQGAEPSATLTRVL